MHRCLELARRGAGYVAPNPLVGAVLVHDDRIIGEGWHRRYGEAHAEVNCISQAVQNGHSALLRDSTLYVSLEPCAHFGKTPPCADLIIRYGIRKVVIGCPDPFKEVNGKGIEKLKAAGLNVESGILEQACRYLNRRFFTFHTENRPYVVLKWAETAEGMIAHPPGAGTRLLISNEYSNRIVHQWRSEEASVLVGTNTALRDDPELTNRLWTGVTPVRLVVDMDLKLPATLKLFNGKVRTIVFNRRQQEERDKLMYYQVTHDNHLVHQILDALYRLNLQSVLVEGGAKLLQSFIDEGCWDEARVIVNSELSIVNGLPAPILSNAIKISEQKILSDFIMNYKFSGTVSGLRAPIPV